MDNFGNQKEEVGVKYNKVYVVTYPFDEYICGVTGLTCCGCSLYCANRKKVKK